MGSRVPLSAPECVCSFFYCWYNHGWSLFVVFNVKLKQNSWIWLSNVFVCVAGWALLAVKISHTKAGVLRVGFISNSVPGCQNIQISYAELLSNLLSCLYLLLAKSDILNMSQLIIFSQCWPSLSHQCQQIVWTVDNVSSIIVQINSLAGTYTVCMCLYSESLSNTTPLHLSAELISIWYQLPSWIRVVTQDLLAHF